MNRDEYERFKIVDRRSMAGKLSPEAERLHNTIYERLTPQQKAAVTRLRRQSEEDWYDREARGPI